MKDEKIKESLNEIFDEADAMVLGTDCGAIIFGKGEVIAKILGLTVANVLFDGTCDEITLKNALVAGFKAAKKAKKFKETMESSNSLKDLDRILKDILNIK